MAISLAIRRERGVERRYEFDKDKITIGANPLCDITVPDRGVDAEQTLLIARTDGVELFDIGARPGTLVNGEPVRHVRLAPGDEVWIGSTVLRLLEGHEGSVSFTEMASTVRAEIRTPGDQPEILLLTCRNVDAVQSRPFSLIKWRDIEVDLAAGCVQAEGGVVREVPMDHAEVAPLPGRQMIAQ